MEKLGRHYIPMSQEGLGTSALRNPFLAHNEPLEAVAKDKDFEEHAPRGTRAGDNPERTNNCHSDIPHLTLEEAAPRFQTFPWML